MLTSRVRRLLSGSKRRPEPIHDMHGRGRVRFRVRCRALLRVHLCLSSMAGVCMASLWASYCQTGLGWEQSHGSGCERERAERMNVR